MKGINAGRVFKTIDTKGHIIHARKHKPDESVNLLSARRSVREGLQPRLHHARHCHPVVVSAQLRTEDKAAGATQKRIKIYGKRVLAGTKAA
jgi:hypothetical protein